MQVSKTRWMALAALFMVIVINVIVDFFLFSGQEGVQVSAFDTSHSERAVASFNSSETDSILKFSWEDEAFTDLKKAKEGDLVARGGSPGPLDHFIFGDLRGRYQVRQENDKVVELHFARPSLKPKNLSDRQGFLEKNLVLFSDEASGVIKISGQHDDASGKKTFNEKFHLLSRSGRSLGQVQFLLDKDQNLISMKVRKFGLK